MRQIFVVSTNGKAIFDTVTWPLWGVSFGYWHANDADAVNGLVIGAFALDGRASAEEVLDALDAAGIEWMPNHQTAQPISAAHAKALSAYGVLPTHTTAEAMTLVNKVAGFPALRPSRF